jgi:hypothetical protein
MTFYESRIKLKSLVSILLITIIFSNCQGVKNNGSSKNYKLIAIEKLNTIDTTVWAFHKSWNLNDTCVVVLAKSKYFDDCHMCGPDLSLVLLTLEQSNGKWTVKKTKSNINQLYLNAS